MADLNKILLNNTFTFPGGFNIDSTEPIDSRFQVETYNDLLKDWANAKVSTGTGDNKVYEAIYKYDGLITYVKETGKSYRYNGSTWDLLPITSEEITSLVNLPTIEIPVKGITVDGVEIEPDENGIVNISLPEIITPDVPQYSISSETDEEAGTISYSLTKDNVATGATIIVPTDAKITNDITNYVNTELVGYNVKDVKAGDSVLSVDANGDLSSTISIAHVKSEDGTKNEIVLRGIDGVQIGDAIDASEFVVDGFLDSVSYDSTSHELVFVFNEYHEGVEGQQEVRVDLTPYIDNHTFSVVNGSWTSITITPTVSEDGTETVFNLTIDDSALTTKLESMEGEIADNSDQIGDVMEMVEAIKQCTSGTISADTSAAGEGEVSVVSNTQVDLSGDGSSLTGSFTAVNVVTKQYVDDRYKIINSTEVLFNIGNTNGIWSVSNIPNNIIDNITEEGLYQINYSNIILSGITFNGPVFMMSVQNTNGRITQHFDLVGFGLATLLTNQNLSFIRYYENGSINPSDPIGWSQPQILEGNKKINNIKLYSGNVEDPTDEQFISVVSNTDIPLSYDGGGQGFYGNLPAVQMPTQKYVDDVFNSIQAISIDDIESLFE